MVGMVCASIVASGVMVLLLRWTRTEGAQAIEDAVENKDIMIDGAAKRELREIRAQQGFSLNRLKIHR